MAVGPDRAFIALGSNLGDREALLAAARDALVATPEIRLVGASHIFETRPMGPAAQGPYLNAVIAVDTGLRARELLERMLEIEAEHGRQRDPGLERWGPRTLDLDLLLYGEQCIAEPGLQVPHPALHERIFVLEPLCELAADRIHPRLGEPLRSYRERFRDPEAISLWPPIERWKVRSLPQPL